MKERRLGTSRVTDEARFLRELDDAIRAFSFEREISDGKHRLKIPGHRSIPFWAPRKQRLFGPHRPSSDMYEPVATAVMSYLMREFRPRTMFDVGGATGYFNFIAASAQAVDATVHAFEMRPDWFALAEEKLAGEDWCRGRVFNHLVGVSDRRVGVKTIWYSKTDLYETKPDPSQYREAWWRRLKRRLKGKADVATLKSADILITSLDDLAREHGAPELIKLDVDGYEAMALPGAAELLNGSPLPFVQFELHKNERLKRFGTSRRELMSFLFERGYRAIAFSDPDDCKGTRIEKVTIDSPEIELERTSFFLMY